MARYTININEDLHIQNLDLKQQLERTSDLLCKAILTIAKMKVDADSGNVDNLIRHYHEYEDGLKNYDQSIP